MSYSKILEQLYLGNQYSTEIIKNIDVIVSIGCNSKNKDNKQNLKISIRDKITTDLTPFLDQVTEYIDVEINKNKNNKILVHCKAGINRSPAFILAYLCKYNNMSIDEAQKYISQRRKVQFKAHYVEQITKWLDNQ